MGHGFKVFLENEGFMQTFLTVKILFFCLEVSLLQNGSTRIIKTKAFICVFVCLEKRLYCVSQAGHELGIYLSQPPKFWD